MDQMKTPRITRWQRVRTRTYLTLIGMKRRMTLGARVVLVDGERVFLIRHTYLPGWQFPGGGVEPGESAEAAGARETFEETGYRVAGRMEMFGLFHNLNSVTNRDHIALFVARSFEAERAFAPGFEIAEGGWFGWNDLPDAVSPGAARRVAEIFGDAERSETW